MTHSADSSFGLVSCSLYLAFVLLAYSSELLLVRPVFKGTVSFCGSTLKFGCLAVSTKASTVSLCISVYCLDGWQGCIIKSSFEPTWTLSMW